MRNCYVSDPPDVGGRGSLQSVVLTIAICDRSRYLSPLWSQFGLSIVAECLWTNGDRRRILFDTGWSWSPLEHNLQELGVDPVSIDWVVLSHCHYDHTGGLRGLLSACGDHTKLVAHQAITRQVLSTAGGLHPIGLESGVLEGIPAHRRLLIKGPTEILPDVWVTGYVPRRTDFETPEEGVFVLQDGQLVPDPEEDDMALVFNLGEEGLVVLTGCGHAGIVNTVLAAQQIVPNAGLLAVVGGFHLIDKSEEVQHKSIDTLKELGVRNVWSGHCTGRIAENMLDEAFGEKHRRFYTGDRICFTRHLGANHSNNYRQGGEFLE